MCVCVCVSERERKRERKRERPGVYLEEEKGAPGMIEQMKLSA